MTDLCSYLTSLLILCLKPPDLNQSPTSVSTTLSDSVSAEEDNADLDLCDSDHSPLLSIASREGDVLSVNQLVVRRGVTLLIMIFILIAGIATSNVLVKLFK